MKRWERTECGKAPRGVDGWYWYIHEDYYKNAYSDMIPFMEKINQENPEHRGRKNDQLEYRTFETALNEHFEIPHNGGDVKMLLQETIRYGMEYFYGDWRNAYQIFPDETYGLEDCRQKLPWINSFRIGILASLLLNDSRHLQEFAKWVGDDLGTYGESGPRKMGDVDWYLLLGHYIRDGSLEPHAALAEKVRSSNRPRTKMALGVLEAVEEGNLKKTEKAFVKKVKNFVKTEILANQPTLTVVLIDYDSSILWNIGLQKGVELPELPEEIMDRIVTSQSMGLTV